MCPLYPEVISLPSPSERFGAGGEQSEIFDHRFLSHETLLGITDSLETNEMICRTRLNSTFWKSYLNCNLVDNTLVKNLVAKLNHVYV